jgi:hypothetical protein
MRYNKYDIPHILITIMVINMRYNKYNIYYTCFIIPNETKKTHTFIHVKYCWQTYLERCLRHLKTLSLPHILITIMVINMRYNKYNIYYTSYINYHKYINLIGQ